MGELRIGPQTYVGCLAAKFKLTKTEKVEIRKIRIKITTHANLNSSLIGLTWVAEHAEATTTLAVYSRTDLPIWIRQSRKRRDEGHGRTVRVKEIAGRGTTLTSHLVISELHHDSTERTGL